MSRDVWKDIEENGKRDYDAVVEVEGEGEEGCVYYGFGWWDDEEYWKFLLSCPVVYHAVGSDEGEKNG